jgi:small subunit ribosomal protein S16
LTRVGATKRPAYRVIAIDKRRSRDGRALEILGFYDPLTEPATVHLDTERINAWIGKGALPSDTVAKLIRQAEKAALEPAVAEKPKRATRAAKPKASAKARAKAKAKAATEAPAVEETAEAPAVAEAPADDAPQAAADEAAA